MKGQANGFGGRRNDPKRGRECRAFVAFVTIVTGRGNKNEVFPSLRKCNFTDWSGDNRDE